MSKCKKTAADRCPRTHQAPATARISITTLRALEQYLGSDLDPAERVSLRAALQPIVADLIDAARWKAEPL